MSAHSHSPSDVCAVIPYYNGGEYIARAYRSVRANIVSPEVIIVNDASDTPLVESTVPGARIVALETNQGRGAARSRGMAETTAPLVLMCDQSVELPEGFLCKCLSGLDDPNVAAVFARICQDPPRTTAERWRERRLFRSRTPAQLNRKALLWTGACLLRRSAIQVVGGFDPRLRAGEDADLGRRLLAAGYDVIADPEISALSFRRETASQVLRRYARWNSPNGMRFRDYLRQIKYATVCLALEDLKAGDPAAALLSLLAPHFQYWSRNLDR